MYVITIMSTCTCFLNTESDSLDIIFPYMIMYVLMHLQGMMIVKLFMSMSPCIT
jgi:hypothetical protein